MLYNSYIVEWKLQLTIVIVTLLGRNDS